MTQGYKNDSEKVQLHRIPASYMFELAEVLKFGVDKYHEWNWAHNLKWSRVYNAALRHLLAWWWSKSGTLENYMFGTMDTETGKSHLIHAAACVLFLYCYERWDLEGDDRPLDEEVRGTDAKSS